MWAGEGSAIAGERWEERVSIQVTGLHKAYGGVKAVDGVDLSVGEGEMVVVLGPSGCGKTTTMRCIAGLETPTSGRIAIGGATMYDEHTNVPTNRRHVGMVFQSYAIWPHMTVFENVAFPLEMEGVAKAEVAERVNAMLREVGLGDRYLASLGPWREMLGQGLTTWAEWSGADTRSDCHA